MTDARPAPHAAADRRLQRLDALGHLLDDSLRIPVLGYRIGWDAVIGLVPGFGDVAGMVLSAYLVLEASRFGVPRASLVRMVLNIVVEGLLGIIPVLGDVFDATFKANLRNLALLHAHLGEAPVRQHRADRRFLALLVVAMLVLLAVVIGGLWLLAEGLNALAG